jgi:hypothetical protein
MARISNGEKRPAEATPTAKRREDLRLHDATPETLAKALFGGAPKRPETRRAPKVATP